MDGGEDELTLFVKSSPENTGELGACVFCHRIFLVMRIKRLSFNVTIVDQNRMTKDIKDTLQGRPLPALQYGSGVFISDIRDIEEWLERVFVDVSLTPGNIKSTNIGDNVFQRFTRLIKSDSSKDELNKKHLTDELGTIDAFLREGRKEHNGVYLDGPDMTLGDCALLPKLYHIKVAADYFKGYKIPSAFTYLLEYMLAGESSESFKFTSYEQKEVLHWWEHHGAVRPAKNK